MISGLLFGVNAALNLALALALARVMPASSYGALATWTAAALFAATAAFDWVRFSAMRFYTPRSREEEPGIRATLDRSFAASAPLAALALLAAAGLDWLPALDLVGGLALAALALGNAASEYLAALARNLGRTGTYAKLILARHVLTLGVALPVAALTRSPQLTLIALAVAVWPSVLYGLLALRDARGAATRAWLRRFVVYGTPLIAAEAAFQGMSLINRLWLAAKVDLAAAGIYALAFDLTFKVVAVVASVAEAALLPRLVSRAGMEGEARPELGQAIALTLLLTVPAGVAFWVLARPFAALALAPEYRAGFLGALGTALACAGLYVFQTYVLRPTFQISLRTGPLLQSALLAFLLDAALLVGWRPTAPQGVMLAHLIGLAAGAALLLARCLVRREGAWPVLDTLKIAAISALVAAAGHAATASAAAPLPALLAGGLAMAAAFAASALVLDPIGLRRLAWSRWRRPAAPAAAGGGLAA